MPNHEISDWQKITIMATAPFFGNRAVAKKANVSVWTVRKYRSRMVERGKPLNVGETDEDEALISAEALKVLDQIVQEGLSEETGRI